MGLNNLFDQGKRTEREAIREQFKQRQDIRDKLHELDNEFRHHSVALKNKGVLALAKYRYCLGSDYLMLNQIYAEQFISQYPKLRSELEDCLEDIDSALFDITEGRF